MKIMRCHLLTEAVVEAEDELGKTDTFLGCQGLGNEAEGVLTDVDPE